MNTLLIKTKFIKIIALAVIVFFISFGTFAVLKTHAQEVDNSDAQSQVDPQDVTPPTDVPVDPDASTPSADTSTDVTPPTDTSSDVIPPSDTSDITPPTDTPPEIAPTLSTDADDYHPGQVATIFGHFFQALQNIVLHIFGSTDDNNSNYTEETQNITTDANGDFTTTYTLDDTYRPFYDMTASVLDTVVASGWFRDSAIGTYDQCSNDLGTGYSSGDTGCRWINGNLNANNSLYIEGDSTVQRLWMEGYAPGSTHTVTFQYGTTKAGKHAYDFLTTWDASENWITLADRCQDITGCTTASETTLPIPSDTNGSGQFESTFATRDFTMRGGTLNSATSPTIVSGSYSGDSETAITVTFTVASSGAMCSTVHNVTSCGIAMWFGAHIAKTSDWSPFNGSTGAGSISGSPYHVALDQADGASVGQRDNQMQSNTIIPASTITIHKVTSPNASDPTVFNFGTTGTGYSAFTLTGGNQNSQTITGTGNFSVTETIPSGWNNTALTCTATGTGSSATPNLGAHSVAITIGSTGGATIDCIYTNTLQEAHLTLVKTVTNDNGGTAVPTAWTLNASGPTPISGVTGSGAVTNAAVNAGTYALSETGGPSGYTAGAWSCTGGSQSGNNITLTAGQSATCTINNNDNAAHLIVIKHVINDNGGTATASNFTMTIGGVTAVGGNSFAGAEAPGTDKTLSTLGSYTVTEGAVAGYTQTSASADCSGTIALGQTKTCTITNNDVAPHLIVIKHVINDNGGTAVAGDFTMNITGTNVSNASSAGAEAPGTDHTLNAGAYSVAETSVTGYTQVSASADCSGTIAVGETKTCTITNNDIQPKLTLTKIVINDNGGTKVVSDFPLFVNSTGVTSGIQNGFNAGTYTASETSQTGYAASSWTGDCASNGSVTLNPGDVKACTITNNDIAPTLTLIKTVINDNGGTATTTDFQGMIDSGNVPWNSAQTVNAGAHTATETTLPGYTASVWGGDCASNGTITLGLAENKTCTITNNDQQAYITVNKVVINDNGGTAQPNDFALTLEGSPTTSGTPVPVNPGTYTSGETLVPGYSFTGFSGDCDESGDTTVALGESKTCTLTNNDIQPTLTLIKHVINDNGGTKVVSDFPLFVNTTGVVSGVTNGFNAGNYTASETNQTGYTATGWSGDCASDGTVTLGIGQNKTCEITNNDNAPILHLRKVVINDNGGSATTADFTLTANGTGSNDLSGTSPVDSGAGLLADTFALSETTMSGYTASAWSCVGGTQNGSNITLGLGQEATCTITNDDQQSYIIVNKTVINDNGGTAVANDFLLTVDTNAVSDEVAYPVNPGTHTAGETLLTGYTAGAWGGDCNTSASVTVALGETKTCTITNNDVAPHLIVIKHVINDNGGTAVAGDFTMNITGTNVSNASSAGAEAPGTDHTLNAGAYSVAEVGVTGYSQTSASADCSGTIAIGQTKTCTIVNDDIQPTLTLIKHVINDNGGTKVVSDFPLFVNTTGVVSGVSNGFNAGSYTASETTQTGYTASAWSGDCAANGSVTLSVGDVKSCTITNDDQPATLIIVKNAEPNDCQDFNFAMTGQSNFTLDDNAGVQDCLDTDQPQSKTTNNLNANTNITVTETMPNQFWLLDSISCVVTGTETAYPFTTVANGMTVNLPLGGSVTCTFNNDKTSPTRTQGFWQTHTAYTSTVSANAGGIKIGNVGTHKVGTGTAGALSNGVTAGTSELFGAFFSNIAKTTTNSQRTALDKARMQLLQQLVAAKLNCAAFGCSGTVAGQIAAADVAFAGTNVSAILTSAGVMDAYNNSGDTIIIGSAGKATPKDSQSRANKVFWNLP